MNLGIISIYPPPNVKHAKLGGVGSYTKNLVDSFKNKFFKIFVFSNKNPDKKEKTIKDAGNNVSILYCWDVGSFRYPLQIFWNVFKKRHEIDVLHIQYEVFLFGGFLYALLFPFLLTFLKLLKTPIVVTIHQVVPLSQVNKLFLKKLGVKGNPFLFKIGLLLLINYVFFFSDSIVVHEKPFKKSLIEEYGCKQKEKIDVIPHGVEQDFKKIEKQHAKEVLNLKNKKIILFFGYLSTYKGIDILIDSLNYLHLKDLVLIIAGGKHPRLKNDSSYQRFLTSIKNKASATKKNVVFTDFVSEKKIPIYFSAADLLVFPYVVVMSSSGPMSLALTYEKPFLASDSYSEIIDDLLLFEKKPKKIAEKIETLLKDKKVEMNITAYVKKLKKNRSWEETGKTHVEVYRKLIKQQVSK